MAAGDTGSTGGTYVDPMAGTQTGVESSLSSWAGPYVTDMLGKAWALAEQPYEAYTDTLTAGPSALQNQAFTGLSGLAMPSSVSSAANTLGSLGTQAAGMSYAPSTFTNQFQAPGTYTTTQFNNPYAALPDYAATTFTNQFQAPRAYQTGAFNTQFQAPGAYDTTQFNNQFQAPQDYVATQFASQFQLPDEYKALTQEQYANLFTAPGAYQSRDFQGGTFDTAAAQQYMNPYLMQALNPQLGEARRQAELQRLQDASRLSKAGAYGGSRQAVMESELNRNLLQNLADITGTGYATAYDKAQQAFTQDQARRLEAEGMGEQSRQFGATYGLNAADIAAKYGLAGLNAAEQSRQFAAQQNMTAQQLMAQFGLDAQKATEMSRQFAAGQQMTAADLQARYGLDAQKATELSRQFGAQQQMTAADLATRYGLQREEALEASRQFGAQQQMTAADLQARYGLSAQEASELSRQFAYGQKASAQDLMARYGLDAQKATELSRQFGAEQQMTAADLAARYGLEAQRLGETSKQFGASYGLDALQAQLQAAQAQGNLGLAEYQNQLSGLNALLSAGNTQRAIDAEGIAADRAQWEQQQAYPYQQLQFMQSMLQGLPVQTNQYSYMEPSGLSSLLGGTGSVLKLLSDLGIDPSTWFSGGSGGTANFNDLTPEQRALLNIPEPQ